MPISELLINDKNKLSSKNVTLFLFSIDIPDDPGPPIHYTTIRLVDGNASVTWQNSEWLPIPFQWSEFVDSNKGEIPRIDFSVSNIDRQMEFYMQSYDLYTKINGYTPIYINIYMVNTVSISNDIPEVEYCFQLQDIRSDARWITFSLGAKDPYNSRFPLNRFIKNNGRVKKFGDIYCGTQFTSGTCDRTLTMCRHYGNSKRFCGFPGMGNRSIRLNS